MRTLLVCVAFLLAACSQPTASVATPTPTPVPTPTAPPPSPSPSPSPTPPPALHGAYAVLVNDFLDSRGPTYTLSIVDTTGHVVATTSPRKRTVPYVQVGNLSTSNTTVYYLDGDSDVRFVRPDKSTGLATHITLGPKQAAAFAVSPDDSRIAVSVLDYTHYPVSTRLYVEDLHGGGNHVELFYSAVVMEWPVGWHAGRLVMALGIDAPPQQTFDGFASAFGYHVVNAQSGARLLSLCTGKDSYVPVSAGGAVCSDLQTGSATSWDGRAHVVPFARKQDSTSGNCKLVGPMSPAGVIASGVASSSQGGCGGGPIFLVTASGAVSTQPVDSNVSPAGWINATDLMVDASISTSSSTPVLSILNVGTRASTRVQAPGYFVAVLPGAL